MVFNNLFRKNVLSFSTVSQGTSLWSANRKDECGELYIRSVQESLRKLPAGPRRDALSDALSAATARGVQKFKAALSLRKAIDTFNTSCAEVRRCCRSFKILLMK